MTAAPLYIAVAFNVPLDRCFHYSVPEPLRDAVAVGKRVVASFGRRRATGYCVGFVETPEVPRVKPITAVADDNPVVGEEILGLTRWIADFYGCSWGEALDAALPAGVKKKSARKKVHWVRLEAAPAEAEAQIAELAAAAPAQARMLSVLADAGGEAALSDVAAAAECSPATLKALVRKGFVSSVHLHAEAIPYIETPVERKTPPKPTREQEKAVAWAAETIGAGRFGVLMLYGVTGSGKTEVYLRAIESAVAAGRQAIVLVPEIALTPQMVRRFAERFDRVAVLHSHLTEGQRSGQWQRIREGADVVIGARSAIFAPVPRLGIVVVDEEHEHTFKQETAPRYNARDMAVVRAKGAGAAVILGSATPSMETWQNARSGKYASALLTERIAGGRLPPVQIVDMRYEPGGKKGPRILCHRLRMSIDESLRKGEQVILFLNRRGFSTFITCPRCGHTLKCSQCDVSLTYHRAAGWAVCHYCSHRVKPPEECPECLAPGIRYLGIGTEKVEEEIARLWPGEELVRMDSDTMRSRNAYHAALGRFHSGEARILIGTQMIAKGLDFPNVTLVGVISADVGLNMPDFRAAERTFQLVAQVAGRAGRGPKGGNVIVQSFNPDNHSIQTAARYAYEEFAERELAARKELQYPPFGRLIRILVWGPSEEAVRKSAQDVYDALAANKPGPVRILGPAPAPLSRIKGSYRWHLLLKVPNAGILRETVTVCRPLVKHAGKISVSLDVDPVSTL